MRYLNYHKHELGEAVSKIDIFDHVEMGKMYPVTLPDTLSENMIARVVDQIRRYFRYNLLPNQSMTWDKEIFDHEDAYHKGVAKTVGVTSKDTLYNFLNKWSRYDEEEATKFPVGNMQVAKKTDGLVHELQGTFIKRLFAYFWKEYGIKLPPELGGQLGGFIGQERGCSDIFMSFDPVANYRAGAFGDSESCFWTERQGARVIIRHEGGSFVLFWGNANDKITSWGRTEFGSGIARGWIIPISGHLHTKTPAYLFCNVYTDDNAFGRYTAVRALSNVLGLPYKHIRSVNSGLNQLYTNGNSGFLFTSDMELLENTDDINLDFPSCYDSVYKDPLLDFGSCDEYYCEGCDEYVCEDDYHGDNYCNECWHEHYWTCDRCNRTMSRYNDTSVYCEWTIGIYKMNGDVCEDCAVNLGYHRCDDCGDWGKDFNYSESREEYYCDSCYQDLLDTCQECGVVMESDQMVVNIDHGYFCSETCLEKFQSRLEGDSETNTN